MDTAGCVAATTALLERAREARGGFPAAGQAHSQAGSGGRQALLRRRADREAQVWEEHIRAAAALFDIHVVAYDTAVERGTSPHSTAADEGVPSQAPLQLPLPVLPPVPPVPPTLLMPRSPTAPSSFAPSTAPAAAQRRPRRLHVVCAARDALVNGSVEAYLEGLPSAPPEDAAAAAAVLDAGTVAPQSDVPVAAGSIDGYVQQYAAGGGCGFFMEPVPPTTPAVVVVAEHNDAASLSRLLAHELVHAVDAVVHGAKLTVAGYLACSEVRAAAASECAGVWPPFLARRCVADYARRSTAIVFPDIAPEVVHTVLPDCIRLPIDASPLQAAVFTALPPAPPPLR